MLVCGWLVCVFKLMEEFNLVLGVGELWCAVAFLSSFAFFPGLGSRLSWTVASVRLKDELVSLREQPDEDFR